MTAAAPPLLQIENVTKRFGGLTALSEVSFVIPKGQIYGLIGPNGAGKTTLFNVLTGLYRQDEGRFLFEGKPLRNVTPDRIAALGIARTFQNIRLFANLSALENVMIGRHVRTHATVFGAVFRTARTRGEERAWFDDRSARAVAGSAAGLEAIAELNGQGGQVHPAAAERLALDIRSRLEELGAVLSL